MFGLGVPELVLILIIGLVVFGPGKLPSVGHALGRSLREFKTAVASDGKEIAAGTDRETARES
ncbi:MAG: twin-arginine translocase TatA/TatE family subunit [Schwartzia sp.]|nr:twin-arginine translocase TatA/TatE family subunit [Schwartzia sp. (in: firmicutes)]